MINIKEIQEAYQIEISSRNEFNKLIMNESNKNIIDFKSRFNNAKEINTSKHFILGSLISSKVNEKNAEKVESILSSNNLSYTYNTNSGKLIYTSPDMKLKGKEVRFMSSATPSCNDGYASIKNLSTLNNFISFYNYLEENKEELFDKYMESCCKYLYEDRNETIDKNYNWIFKNWVKIKNVYIYTIYSYGSTDMYCDVEVDITKCKGLQDYLSKKSCTVLFIRCNLNTGKMFVGQDILNDRTDLFDVEKK